MERKVRRQEIAKHKERVAVGVAHNQAQAETEIYLRRMKAARTAMEE